MLREVKGQGIEVSLDEYVRVRDQGGNGALWDAKYRAALFNSDSGLERFLARVHEVPERNVAFFQMTSGEREVASTSAPIDPKRGVPASEKAEFERAISQFHKLAEDPHADPEFRVLAKSLQFPDPARSPDMYRLYHEAGLLGWLLGRKRLLVLWGCTQHGNNPVSPLEAAQALRIDGLAGLERWWKALLLLLIAVLALAVWWLAGSTSTPSEKPLVARFQKIDMKAGYALIGSPLSTMPDGVPTQMLIAPTTQPFVLRWERDRTCWVKWQDTDRCIRLASGDSRSEQPANRPGSAPFDTNAQADPTQGPANAAPKTSGKGDPFDTNANADPTPGPANAAPKINGKGDPFDTNVKADPTEGPANAAPKTNGKGDPFDTNVKADPTQGPANADPKTTGKGDPFDTNAKADPTQGPANADPKTNGKGDPFDTNAKADPTQGPANAAPKTNGKGDPFATNAKADSTQGPANADPKTNENPVGANAQTDPTQTPASANPKAGGKGDPFGDSAKAEPTQPPANTNPNADPAQRDFIITLTGDEKVESGRTEFTLLVKDKRDANRMGFEVKDWYINWLKQDRHEASYTIRIAPDQKEVKVRVELEYGKFFNKKEAVASARISIERTVTGKVRLQPGE